MDDEEEEEIDFSDIPKGTSKIKKPGHGLGSLDGLMIPQRGFFDFENGLDERQDMLIAVNAAVPWDDFRPLLLHLKGFPVPAA